MPKAKHLYQVIVTLTCEIEADTVEEVKQQVDNAMDYSQLRERGVNVKGDVVAISEVE